MGHQTSADVYRRLGTTIDSLFYRAPWNETLRDILTELCSRDEAELITRMPLRLSPLDRVSRISGYEESGLRSRLESLADKGLVVDLDVDGKLHYMPSPFMVGFYEFTMMRLPDASFDRKKLAGLFRSYLCEKSELVAAGEAPEPPSIARVTPHEGVAADHVEILSYERARALVEEAEMLSLGVCSCRRSKAHNGEKSCNIPDLTCTSMGYAADYLIRHNMAQKIGTAQALDVIDRSRDIGLVLSADNVQKRPAFLCHCCGCCCVLMEGLTVHGYEKPIVTSGLIPIIDEELCVRCGTCAQVCPVGAVEAEEETSSVADPNRPGPPRVNTNICLGCGVCALKCRKGAVSLERGAAVIVTPEDTFQRIVLQCLDQGTLGSQLFDDPDRWTHRLMRHFLDGVLSLPSAKRALVSNSLRSVFLGGAGAAAGSVGAGALTKL